ncbi:dihydroorotate dehydrogenase electron transfer subunit [Vagococcus xieshaowenii]|uniref:Dihydroorotate dehydrogenase B (NAD(+)), electron transfer subunit n=2 Tax=Vagococcus xieshaowenii TaxID=2562451 RepID=A0AAJ5JQE2_9ENTE|nr:dihydroorotate dehydrogenase electron transfer subunit [Vagococcus xieshaowenii]QCA28594.1 dihydroorotate dehydrogenase electron transfer subunit [Vagococcus xieshaowenii]TFZ40598.1 dihydroorotate dehydrogenase electron transfer subunit [Vagococcus xieshaowenii]
MKQENMKVIEQKTLAPNIFEMTLEGEMVQEMLVPGQFLHCQPPNRSDLLLRRPISISSIDLDNRQCKLIYRAEGAGTVAMSQLSANQSLDVLGPLGNGFPVEDISEGELVIVIGGGIGIPPLYEVAKQAVLRGAKVIAFLGFASKEVMFYLEEFQALGDVHVSTDDGSYGTKGHLGLVLDEVLPLIEPSAVYSCGPTPLLAKVDQYFEEHPRAYVSLEERMACGVGACAACVCQTKDKKTKRMKLKKVCDEGPVFATGVVNI